MTQKLKITLRTGEVYTFVPDADVVINYEVVDEALVISKRATGTHTNYHTCRIFAPGVWRDIEVL